MNSDKDQRKLFLIKRRQFVLNSLMTAAGLATISPNRAGGFLKNFNTGKKDYTVQDIINILIKPVKGAPFAQTVDTLKSGSPDQKVTGIVTTMFATLSVIHETVQKGANFIVAHEPTFYNHTDEPEWAGPNKMVKEKQDLLKKNGIAVWRFHDYWHSYQPDGILQGVLNSLGWENYFDPKARIVNLPATPLLQVAEQVKKSLDIKHVRMIGDPNLVCKRVALMPGAAGGQSQMKMIEQTEPDLFICGEIHEWETGEYIRDKTLSGKKTSLIVLGHSQSEEPGMKYLVGILKPQVGGIPVYHIPSGDPFTWV